MTTKKILPSLIALFAVTIALPQFVSATHPKKPCRDVIYLGANDVECASKDMKGEIKTHFRGVKGYGKMLCANTKVRVKAAAIQRRIKRDNCYKCLEKDVNKLDRLVCELQEEFEAALACSSPKRPVRGDVSHVEAKLISVRQWTSALQTEVCNRLGKTVAAPVIISELPIINQPAPIVVPPHFAPQHTVPHQQLPVLEPSIVEPPITEPAPAFGIQADPASVRSVLEDVLAEPDFE